MILYFDNYITDIPLGKPRPVKDDYRSKAKIYALPSRFTVAKYVLASYAALPWSNVLIKYQIDDEKQNLEFENFARGLFPKATIINNRSATQAEYKKSLALLEQMDDDWIFYAPNSDHPLLLSSPSQIDYISRLFKRAEKYRGQYKFFSVPYSMYTEYVNVAKPGSLNFGTFGEAKILEEDSEAIIVLQANGDFNSVSIVHKDLFAHYFASTHLGDMRLIRVEDLKGHVEIKNQVVITPKIELAAHFDGYDHMLGGLNEIQLDQIPPQFIPPGFFENNIRVAFGYSQYRPGWVNINPAAKRYSFRDAKFGTDLKIGLQDMPMFWKSRIRETDINKEADLALLERGRSRHLEIVNYPWSIKNQGWNFKTLRFWLKRPFIRFYPVINKLGLMPAVKKIGRTLGFY